VLSGPFHLMKFSVVKIEIGASLIEAIGSKTKIVKPKKKISELLDAEKEIMSSEDDVPFYSLYLTNPNP